MIAGNHIDRCTGFFDLPERAGQSYMTGCFSVEGQITGNEQGIRSLVCDFCLECIQQCFAFMCYFSITLQKNTFKISAGIVKLRSKVMQVCDKHQPGICSGGCHTDETEQQNHQTDRLFHISLLIPAAEDQDWFHAVRLSDPVPPHAPIHAHGPSVQ